MQKVDRLPSHAAMAWPALLAIKRAGGTATNSQIMQAVADDLQLSDEQRAVTRTRKGSRTLLDYRLAWSRTLLKNMGAITYDGPCTWSITEAGYKIAPDDIQAFVKKMLDNLARSRRQSAPEPS